MSKEKPINDLAKTIINLSLNLAEGQIRNRVQDVTLKGGVETVLPLIREIVTELNDNNPENAAQVKETLMAWTNGPMATYLESLLNELIEKLDAPGEKALVRFIGLNVIAILRLITDLEDNNVQQIRTYWKDEKFLLEAQQTLMENVLLPALENKGVSQEIKNYIHSIINLTLITFMHKNA